MSCNSVPETQKVVYIQVVFIKLGEIDTVKETFSADVFVQARWREPTFDGDHTARTTDPRTIDWSQYWNPMIYVDNRKVVGDWKETIGHTVLYDVGTWQAFFVERRRLKGTFLEKLELFNFPFDTQDLTITIASQRSKDEIILEDDELQRSTINVESFVDEQEWRLYDEVETFKGSVSKFYEGDDAENCIHPTFSCRTHATRRSGFYTTNIFVVMFFICSMTFSTFSVKYLKRENRLQLSFILLLTTVTFKFAVNSSLPRISYLTTLDVYIITSMTIVILVCVWHAIVPAIYYTWGKAVADTSDIVLAVILGTAYVMAHVIFACIIGNRVRRRKRYYEERERMHKSLLHKDRTPVGDAMAVDSHLHDIRRASNVKMPHVVVIPAGTGQDQPHFDDHTTQPRSSSLSNLVSCTKVQGGPSPQKSTEQTSPHFPVPGTTFSTHPHSSLPIL